MFYYSVSMETLAQSILQCGDTKTHVFLRSDSGYPSIRDQVSMLPNFESETCQKWCYETSRAETQKMTQLPSTSVGLLTLRTYPRGWKWRPQAGGPALRPRQDFTDSQYWLPDICVDSLRWTQLRLLGHPQSGWSFRHHEMKVKKAHSTLPEFLVLRICDIVFAVDINISCTAADK